MTNDHNIVRGRHFDSLAADVKRFSLEQNLALNQAIQDELAEIDTGGSGAAMVLSTVPSTVEGALWLDVSGDSPALKVFYGGVPYSVA